MLSRLTSLPVVVKLMLKNVDWLFSGEIMKEARINVIDVSFALQAQVTRRNPDGIHWSPECNRSGVRWTMLVMLKVTEIFLQAHDPHQPHPPHTDPAWLGIWPSARECEQRLLDQSHSTVYNRKLEGLLKLWNRILHQHLNNPSTFILPTLSSRPKSPQKVIKNTW